MWLVEIELAAAGIRCGELPTEGADLLTHLEGGRQADA
jgi:hypothetical protein